MSRRTTLHGPDVPAVNGEPLTSAEQVRGLLFGLWMVVGLFLDGWAHDDGRPESFFTPWHAVLYSGFAATALAALFVVRRRWDRNDPVRAAVPPGHGLTLLGLAGFALAAVGDLLWHEGFGIEVGVEALLSPTHLLLFASGLLVLSAPVRSRWATPGDDNVRLGPFLPVVANVALLIGVMGFFLAYLSPFVNDAAAQAFDPSRVPHQHPSTDAEELQQLLALASVLVTTLLLALPTYAVLRRWRTPPGSMTVLLGLATFLLVGLDQFGEWYVVLAGLAAGAVIDVLCPRFGITVAVSAGIIVFWAGYVAVHALVGDRVGWSAELIGGAIVLSGLLAVGVGLDPTRSRVDYDTLS